MKTSIHRMILRLIVPVIALLALVMTGEPVTQSHETALVATQASRDASHDDAAAEHTETLSVAQQRNRTATRLRWGVTLPVISRSLGQ